MTPLLQYIIEKKHHVFREKIDWNAAEEFSKLNLTPVERMTRRFEKMCALQTPAFLPDEQICFLRTAVTESNEVFTAEEWDAIKKEHYIHELGYHSNLSPDYESAIAEGLLKKRETADEYSRRSIDALLELTDRYCKAAEEKGLKETAAVLRRVPRYGATSFREALQSFRVIHFGLWLENDYHNTVGRFDQYMFPYLKADMEKGILDRDSALALLEDFFLSFNKDSDLYVGVQQGDNGQSMMLGGLDIDGNDCFNLLSELCLIASGNLKLIDPKINLRVGKNTPIEVFELGSELTKAGLGFPQYSNDDIVIDALVDLGYDREDAVNYVTAACWEFIIPKVAADIDNIGALSFPLCVDRAIHRVLAECKTFDELMVQVQKEINAQADEICKSFDNLWFVPSPLMNMLMGNKLDSNEMKYINYGIHGTGIATAADSLAAIKKYIFDEKRITAQEMLDAVDNDFAGHEEMLALLRYEAPKMGQNQQLPDSMASQLLNWFADSLQGRKNEFGGIYRAGSGSAMFYLWHADELGASPDGRRKGEAFGTNYSPSLFAKIDGPLSVIRSFTNQPLARVMNGGPLTLEFHHSMFRDADCVSKVAQLVKSFVMLGGHQLQLNAVNLDRMKEAQEHPELHRQLVVRIWGWSAYFVELDRAYQDHVMARQEYVV